MEANKVYSWQLETNTGQVVNQYNEDGSENKVEVAPASILRFSFLSDLPFIVPKHDIFIDVNGGNIFIRRFGRGFIRQTSEGFQLQDYAQCLCTKHFRYYVTSSGQCILTPPDYELYL